MVCSTHLSSAGCGSVLLPSGGVSGVFGLQPCADARIGEPPEQLHATRELKPVPFQQPIQLLLDARDGDGDGGPLRTNFRPSASMIIAVHNNVPALRVSVPLLLKHTEGCVEILFMLDDCTRDVFGSLKTLLRKDDAFRRSALRRVRVLESRSPLWEGGSETLLMSVSNPREYYISVQPDCFVGEPGWNLRLAVPARAFADVFAVSAHMATATGHGVQGSFRHLFLEAKDPTIRDQPHGRDYEYMRSRRIPMDYINRTMRSRLDRAEQLQVRNVLPNVGGELRGAFLESERGIFHVRETVNRGPMLLHAARARQLMFFDHELYWLEDSDHDLMCRAAQLGWAVGFYALNTTGPALAVDPITGSPIRHTRELSQSNGSSLLRDRRAQIEAGTYERSSPVPRRGCVEANAAAIRSAAIRAEDRRVDNEAGWIRQMCEVVCVGAGGGGGNHGGGSRSNTSTINVLPMVSEESLHHGVCHEKWTPGGRRMKHRTALPVPWPGWPGWTQAPGEWYRTPTDGVLACSCGPPISERLASLATHRLLVSLRHRLLLCPILHVPHEALWRPLHAQVIFASRLPLIAQREIFGCERFSKLVLISDPLERLLDAYLDVCVAEPPSSYTHRRHCLFFAGRTPTLSEFIARLTTSTTLTTPHLNLQRNFCQLKPWKGGRLGVRASARADEDGEPLLPRYNVLRLSDTPERLLQTADDALRRAGVHDDDILRAVRHNLSLGATQRAADVAMRLRAHYTRAAAAKALRLYAGDYEAFGLTRPNLSSFAA